MARLTLSEQVASLQAQLSAANETIAVQKAEIAANFRDMEASALVVARLKVQENDFIAGKDKITALEKELATSKSNYTYATSERTKAEGELEQAHAVLDGVDGAPAREYDMEYGKGKRNVVTRLAGAFLAIAKNGGAK